MTTSPEIVAGVVDELAGAIEALALTVGSPDDVVALEVVRGWPANMASLHLPTVSVFSGRALYSWRFPELVEIQDGESADVARAMFRIAQIEIPIQLDLWTASKTDRYVLEPQIMRLFAPEIDLEGGLLTEVPAGLPLTLADAHGEPCRVFADDTGHHDDQGPQSGSFRASWGLRAHTELWEAKEAPRMTFAATVTTEE